MDLFEWARVEVSTEGLGLERRDPIGAKSQAFGGRLGPLYFFLSLLAGLFCKPRGLVIPHLAVKLAWPRDYNLPLLSC